MIADAGFIVEDKESAPGELLARGLHRADFEAEPEAAVGGCGGHGSQGESGAEGGCGGCGSACGSHNADTDTHAHSDQVDAERAAADRVMATAAAFAGGGAATEAVKVRRRGIGTDVAPNA